MNRTIFDPLLEKVDSTRRQQAQEDFGRHVVEQRNRMAILVQRWIESDEPFPIPIYDRMLEPVRQMDAAARRNIASICLLMSDQIVGAVLGVFDGGDELLAEGQAVNYAIVAQIRQPESEEVIEEIDVNRGKPVVAIWAKYKRWLSRFAPDK